MAAEASLAELGPAAVVASAAAGGYALHKATEGDETAEVGDSAGQQGVIQVTPQGVALPPGKTIPKGLVENPNRPGSYGVMDNDKFKETLRIDPATPRGQSGPEHSHYHLNGGKQHYAPGRNDPGFK